MSDLRYDPIFGQWACIAERRQSRPFEFQQITQRRAGIDCPFCRGNESVTPPAISEWSGDGPNPETGSDWLIRIVPNKYPAFDPSLVVAEQSAGWIGNHLHTAASETTSDGYQEVIVLSPRHVVSLSGLSDNELSASFTAFQHRYRHHAQRSCIRHVCLFMNCRPLAGASIEHAHFQLIASPVCTDQVKNRVMRMNAIDNGQDVSTWQALLRWESDTGDRMIQDGEHFQVYCPFASRYSNQIRIAPKDGSSSFSSLNPESLRELSWLCRRWIDGIERCLDDPAYNLIFHLPPTEDRNSAWFVDLVPRFPQAAGFELATDCWVNPVSPETAAEQFRRFADLG